MKTYRCPVCKKPLTKEEYERALGILGEREKHLHEREDKLRRQLQDSQEREKSARSERIKKGWERAKRHMQGQDRVIETLRERIRELKRGSTPQTEGLEFEDKLAARITNGRCGPFFDTEASSNGYAGSVLQFEPASSWSWNQVPRGASEPQESAVLVPLVP